MCGDAAKSELYGWLRMKPPIELEPYPPGYCHFPELGPDYFKQLTSEHLVRVAERTGHVKLEWQVSPGRENHWLDCRVYARAAAAVAGLDRLAPVVPAAAPPAAPVFQTPRTPPRSDSRFAPFRDKGSFWKR